jgi:hypothetical protein
MEYVFDILENLVAENVVVNYALGGATAAGLHGEPLATRDIDVFVYLPTPTHGLISLSALFSNLATRGFKSFEGETLLIHDYPVQFLAANPGLEEQAITEAITLSWDNHRVRVITPEFLAAIALSVGRPKDRARLLFLIDLPQFDRFTFEKIIASHQLTETWNTWRSQLDLR